MTSVLDQFIRGQQQAMEMQQAQQALPIQQRQREIGLSEAELQQQIAKNKLLKNSIESIQAATADPNERMKLTQQAIPELKRFGLDINLQGATVDNFTDEGLEKYKAVVVGSLPKDGEDLTAFQSRMKFLGEQLESAINPETGQLLDRENLSAMQEAAAVELGILPRASISAQERIAVDPGLSQQVGQSQATIAGQKALATEQAKLGVQQEIRPQLERDISIAKTEAKSEGEARTSLEQAKAALPGLREVVSQLRELTPIATANVSGRIFDTAVKELGFGATEGATARAKYIAILDNQLLPLLRQTFGAAFTEKEGERLKATLGDPNATAEEKNAQLDAFIEAKEREIETKERQLNQSSDVEQPNDFGSAEGFQDGQTAVNPQTGESIIVVNGRWVKQ